MSQPTRGTSPGKVTTSIGRSNSPSQASTFITKSGSVTTLERQGHNPRCSPSAKVHDNWESKRLAYDILQDKNTIERIAKAFAV